MLVDPHLEKELEFCCCGARKKKVITLVDINNKLKSK